MTSLRGMLSIVCIVINQPSLIIISDLNLEKSKCIPHLPFREMNKVQVVTQFNQRSRSISVVAQKLQILTLVPEFGPNVEIPKYLYTFGFARWIRLSKVLTKLTKFWITEMHSTKPSNDRASRHKARNWLLLKCVFGRFALICSSKIPLSHHTLAIVEKK